MHSISLKLNLEKSKCYALNLHHIKFTYSYTKIFEMPLVNFPPTLSLTIVFATMTHTLKKTYKWY